MNRSRYFFNGLVLFLFILFVSTGSLLGQDLNPAQWPKMVGYWQFQDVSNLTKATVGQDLQLVGTHQWVPGAYYGDTAILIDTGSYYKCYHQIAPNGGGDSVNRFALMFDFKVDNFDLWHAFHQTDSTNQNDGDCFIKEQDTAYKSPIGTAATGYTLDSIEPGIWYRFVISVCLDSFYRYYINGDLWLEGNVQEVDGRFALTPLVLFFADNNQEDGPIHVSSVAVFDDFLTPAEVALLGGLDPCVANPPIVDLGKDSVVCQNVSVVLDAGPDYKSYLWSTGDTTRQVTIDSTLAVAGLATVWVKAIDMNDCEGGDTINISFINCTSIDELNGDAVLVVYPNPFKEELTLDNVAEMSLISFYTTNGQLVYEQRADKAGVYTIDTSNLVSGSYLLKVTGKTSSRTKVVVKQ